VKEEIEEGGGAKALALSTQRPLYLVSLSPGAKASVKSMLVSVEEATAATAAAVRLILSLKILLTPMIRAAKFPLPRLHPLHLPDPIT